MTKDLCIGNETILTPTTLVYKSILPCVGPNLVSRLGFWSNILVCLYCQGYFSPKTDTYIAASCAY